VPFCKSAKMREKKRLPTDRRIRVYRYFRVFYERSAHEAYVQARARIGSIDAATDDGREQLRAISGFRRVESLTDIGYNIVLGSFIVAKKLLSAVVGKLRAWTQVGSVRLSEAALVSGRESVRTGLEAASRALSADGKRTVKARHKEKRAAAVVEVAVWINANFEKNLYLFRRLYGDELPIGKGDERFYRVFTVLVVVAESLTIPPDAGYVKGYYYYER